MKKLIILAAVAVSIFSFGCKKDNAQKQNDNASKAQAVEKDHIKAYTETDIN